MKEAGLFVATPLGSHSVHIAWSSSMLKAASAFRGRIDIHATFSSLLPRNRDILTFCFLQSTATHMLCVDSDIGFKPEDVSALLATGKDFVGGTYCKKQEDRAIPAGITGRHDGALFEAEWVPAGFLLLSRACVERLFGAYRHLDYDCEPWGRVCGLWQSRPQSPNAGEDVAFCRRWRELGGDIWLHRGVVVQHWDGGMAYEPRPDSHVKITSEDEPAKDAPMNAHSGHRLSTDGWCRDCSVQAFQSEPHKEFPGATIKMYGSLPVYIHEAA